VASVALVGSHELLMRIIRGGQVPAVARCLDDGASVIDPLGEQAAVVFAAELAADRVRSVRAIRPALHAGRPRARRLRECLAPATDTHCGSLGAFARPANSLRGPRASIREMEERND
jgi:hypothetical protein